MNRVHLLIFFTHGFFVTSNNPGESISPGPVVVHDFHVVGISAFPDKTHSVLLIDSYTELALSITQQLLQAIRLRQFQIFKLCCTIELYQSSHGTSLNLLRQLPGKLANKQFGCFLIYEVLDCHK
jgi:hypothetical protein